MISNLPVLAGSAGVMMATPCDVQDLAYGFAITEGIIEDLFEVESFDIVHHQDWIEARFWRDLSGVAYAELTVSSKLLETFRKLKQAFKSNTLILQRL